MTQDKQADEQSDGELGSRLRTLRMSRGLSLRALGREAGLTAAALSQIENSKSSPSVSTLKRVLQALGLTLGEFFSAQESAGEHGFVIPSKHLVDVAGGAGLRYMAVPGAGRGKAIQIMHEIYELHADTGPRPYVHEGEEAGFCISGTIEVTVDGRREILQVGDAYHFPSNLPHRWRNVGRSRAELISACTPPSF